MTATDVRLATSEELAGWETAERRLRLALTRRALAHASGVTLPRLSNHENGRIALTAEERGALEAVLSCGEQERGLPTIAVQYVPAANVSPTEVEQILGGVVRTLFGTGSGRYGADPPPPKGKAAAPLQAAAPSVRPSTAGASLASRGAGRAYS